MLGRAVPRRLLALPLVVMPLLVMPLLVLAPAAAVEVTAAAGPLVEFSVVPLAFTVQTGPDDATTCEVLGDLRVPTTASEDTPAAAILTTNGFGGSKDDGGTQGNRSFAEHYAKRGYVTLSYSGLGFGGSGCLIQLDAPEWDGKVADQLAQFLAGRTGLATRTDTGEAYATGGMVRTEPGPASGQTESALPFDPVVGMIGGSYGGEVQFAAATYGRIDTIIPQITWNDLSYSLAPNNTSAVRDAASPLSVTYATPGTEKVGWTSLFFALGFAQDVVNGQPEQLVEQVLAGGTCPNFDTRACAAKIDMDVDGAPDEATLAFARSASVAGYLADLDLPVLLSQGQADTLFTLKEAIATHAALQAQGNDVKMVWQSWGHSDSSPVPGELDAQQPAEATYLGAMYAAWFDHYLLGEGPKPSLATEYYRDWVTYDGDTAADAAQAYAQAPGYPVAPTQRLFLSGSDALVTDPGSVQAGEAQFASVLPAGLPSSYSEIPVALQDEPVRDTPGTFAQFTTAPLARDLDLAGVPSLTVELSSTGAAAGDAAGAPGQLVLFAKLYDLAPDGTITLQHRLVAPSRIASFDEPVRLELPGVVQRIPAGHRLSVVLAASDSGHRGNNLPAVVTVTTGVLELPVLSAAAAPVTAAPVTAAPVDAAPVDMAPVGAAPSGSPGRTLASTGPAAVLPLAAVTLLGAGVLLRRRRLAGRF